MKRLTLTLGVAAMLAAASPAVAQVPLAEEAYINDSLRAGRIGDFGPHVRGPDEDRRPEKLCA
jgi:hypothetical protein